MKVGDLVTDGSGTPGVITEIRSRRVGMPKPDVFVQWLPTREDVENYLCQQAMLRLARRMDLDEYDNAHPADRNRPIENLEPL